MLKNIKNNGERITIMNEWNHMIQMTEIISFKLKKYCPLLPLPGNHANQTTDRQDSEFWNPTCYCQQFWQCLCCINNQHAYYAIKKINNEHFHFWFGCNIITFWSNPIDASTILLYLYLAFHFSISSGCISNGVSFLFDFLLISFPFAVLIYPPQCRCIVYQANEKFMQFNFVVWSFKSYV